MNSRTPSRLATPKYTDMFQYYKDTKTPYYKNTDRKIPSCRDNCCTDYSQHFLRSRFHRYCKDYTHTAYWAARCLQPSSHYSPVSYNTHNPHKYCWSRLYWLRFHYKPPWPVTPWLRTSLPLENWTGTSRKRRSVGWSNRTWDWRRRRRDCQCQCPQSTWPVRCRLRWLWLCRCTRRLCTGRGWRCRRTAGAVGRGWFGVCVGGAWRKLQRGSWRGWSWESQRGLWRKWNWYYWHVSERWWRVWWSRGRWRWHGGVQRACLWSRRVGSLTRPWETAGRYVNSLWKETKRWFQGVLQRI